MITLQEAQDKKLCRLCEQPMANDRRQTYNFGKEFSHTVCYQKELAKTLQYLASFTKDGWINNIYKTRKGGIEAIWVGTYYQGKGEYPEPRPHEVSPPTLANIIHYYVAVHKWTRCERAEDGYQINEVEIPIKQTAPARKKCTCDSWTIFNKGCQCGGV